MNFFPPGPLAAHVYDNAFVQPQRNTSERSKLNLQRGNKSKSRTHRMIHPSLSKLSSLPSEQSPVKSSLGEGRVKPAFFFMFYLYICSQFQTFLRRRDMRPRQCGIAALRSQDKSPFFVLVLSSTFSQPSGQGLTMKPGHMRNKPTST